MPARPATRAAVCTAMPPTSSSRISISPVWRPQRTSIPRGLSFSMIAGAAHAAGRAVEGGKKAVA